MRAKLAAALARCGLLSNRKASTLAAMMPTVTHWKRIERSGLSSDRGMKTTACYLCAFFGWRRSGEELPLPVLPRHPQHIAFAELVHIAACHKDEVGKAVDVFEGGGRH